LCENPGRTRTRTRYFWRCWWSERPPPTSEGTEVRADTVKNSLNKARTSNLPPNEPGIIFVKVPQTWLEQDDVRKGIYAVVEGFLRNTDRFIYRAARDVVHDDRVSRLISGTHITLDDDS